MSSGGRIESIDLARGVAVTLMILSHGVIALLPFGELPPWGQVPIHLITKFASSLFILVFGIAMAVAYLPHARDPEWPRRRNRLLWTGLTIFFWYKVLTVVEMMQFSSTQQIIDALLYRSFPSFVEILGFYALAFLWVPFLLPWWARMPLWLRLASPVLLMLFGQWLARNFDFWGIEPLQALLVEHEDHYTWGQLARGPLILLGLLIGETVRAGYGRTGRRLLIGLALALGSAVLFAAFWMAAAPEVSEQIQAIAGNAGKHPPELAFMLFSMGGAVMILAAFMLGGERLASILRPFTVIGTNALQAFIFHIVVIFVLFRYVLGYTHNVSYTYALTLTLILITATAIWVKLYGWVRGRLLARGDPGTG